MTQTAISLQGPLLVRSPNWLGDAVMALPAVRNLKSMLGKDRLIVAGPEKLTALWQACPFVDEVVAMDDPKNLGTTARQLSLGKYGSAVLLPNSLRVAAETFLAGIPQRIGYARDARRFLLTHTVPPPPRNPVRLHQRFYYLDLVTALGGPSDDSLPELRKESLTSGRQPVIAVCPGAEYGPAKRWPVENFAAVAKHLAAKHNSKIIILGAPGDMAVAAELAKQLPGSENRTGKTSLAEFMTTLASARLALCNDSGAMHVASALGTPTVAIFGSTEPEMTGPMGPRSRVLRHHVPCSPCFLRECPIDFACMKSITPEMVIDASEALLK